MKFRTAAAADFHIGRVLVRLLSLFRRSPGDLPHPGDLRRILFIKFWGIGSIMEASPLVRRLSAACPGAEMDLLTFSSNVTFAQSLGLFHAVHGIGFRSGLPTCLRQTFGFILHHRRRYDLVVDLEFFANASAVVTALLAGRVSLGFDSFSSARNSLYTRTLVFDHTRHVRHIFLKFVGALDAPMDTPDTTLTRPRIPEEARRLAEAKTPGLDGPGPRIAMNINAGDMCINRRWPRENYTQLAQRILTDFPGAQVYLVGSPDERCDVEEFRDGLAGHNGRVHCLAGNLDILEFSHVLGLMDCFVTNDSGPLHIADSLGVPAIAFFGPETPNLYGPQSDNSLVFYKNMYCSPCLNTYNNKQTKCTDNACMKRITVDEVYAALCDTFLQAPSAR